jgi:23S rRNA (adenine2503-C2)-methyltransferase
MRAGLDVLGLTSVGFAQAAALAVPRGSGLAHQLYTEAHRTGRWDPRAAGLSAGHAAAWEAAFQVGVLAVDRVSDDAGADPSAGAGDGASEPATAKAVMRTHDGYEIECVRIPMRHGPEGGQPSWTLCVSSQVGCRMGCTFCETGRMGLLRNLTAGEIVAQVVTAHAALGWRARNLVFMGMGEALDNVDAVIQALHALTDRRGLAYSHERLTICTSGHAEGITRLAALGWKRLNLSISLNAGDDQLRSRIMPVNRRTPLARLQELLAAYPQRRNFTLGVNYCLLPGINDAIEDAGRVAAFCAPLGRVLVNLIPYNPGSAPIARAPSEDEVVAFIDALRAHGLPVRRRLTKGRGIMAACGQLGRRQRRSAPGPLAAQDASCAEG